MEPGTWPNPPGTDEYALICDRGRQRRLLIVPALFDEAHKLRRLTVQTMRALDRAGIDTFLPDLPGTNESLAPLDRQDLASWREAMNVAAYRFNASHALSIRAGAMLLPEDLPQVRYAPISGKIALRNLLRARVLVDREAGMDTSREDLLAEGRADGLRLAGYSLGSDMVAKLADETETNEQPTDIGQAALGGVALWLRAEATGDVAQTEALARLVTERLE